MSLVARQASDRFTQNILKEFTCSVPDAEVSHALSQHQQYNKDRKGAVNGKDVN